MAKAHRVPLGRKQIRILVDMATHGDGRWPRGWKMSTDERTVVASLHRRGMVTSVGTDAALTEAGQQAVLVEAARVEAVTKRIREEL